VRHLLAVDGSLPDELRDVQFVDSLVALAPQIANLERPVRASYANRLV